MKPTLISDRKNLSMTRFERVAAHGVGVCHNRAYRHVSEVLGIIVICSLEEHAFKDEEVEIVFDFATQSGVAIKNARLFAEVQKLPLPMV